MYRGQQEDRRTAGPELAVVVPFRDEEAVLPLFLTALEEAVTTLGCATEVLMVDDGSSDGGPALVDSAREVWPELTLVRLTRSFGKEGAIKAGLASSTADAVVVMDADLQHPPELIPQMHRLWRETDAWVVEAVKRGRIPRGGLRRLGTALFYRTAERLTGLPMRNRSDLQLLDRHAVDLLLALPERVTIFRGLLAWLDLPRREVRFEVPPRPAGRSRWSLRRLGGQALDMLTGFTNAPLRLMTYASAGFTLLAALLAVQTLYVYLSGEAVEGFTTVILAILATGAVLSMGLGIVGEYLARVYEEVKGRPQYVVESETERSAGVGEASVSR